MFERRGRLSFLSSAATSALAVAILALPETEAQSTSTHPSRPSVLLITLDTVRSDHLGCYGYSRIETPAIDRLAAEGLRFSNAYAQVPITLPSHAVIMTGTYPMFNGVRDFTSRPLPTDIPTLAEIMRRNGYTTAAFVSSFALNSMWGLNRGFEIYDDNVGLDTGRTEDLFLLERRGDKTVDRMLEWLGRQGGKPFFAWLHLYDPHSPYNPPEPYRTRYLGHPYDGEIAFDDTQVGRVLSRLQSLNLHKHTLIMLLSDHGESLGEHRESEHGFFVYNATIRVPLVVKLPTEARTKRRVIDWPVGTVQVAPTIAQICKIPLREMGSFQARSLLQAAEGSQAASEEAIYAESYYPRNSFGWHELRALITLRFKYVDAPRAELYDLKRDPEERANLLSVNSAMAASLHEELVNFEGRFQSQQASAPSPPLDPETLEKLRSLGYIAYKAGASANSTDVARDDPKDKIATLDRILRASDLTRLGGFQEADALLAQLEWSDPKLYVVPFQRGENYLAWEKPQAALPEFQKSLSLNPKFDQAALGLGRAYFMIRQDGDAATAFELALHFSPGNYLARLALAKVYWRQNLLHKAEEELRRVVAARPEFPEAHVDRGIIMVKQEKYSQGRSEIQQGIDRGYRDAIAYNYLGLAYAGLGDHIQAIRAYEQAVALDPHYAAATMNLALEFLKQGKTHQARSYYRKTCELNEGLCRPYESQFVVDQ